ncbi:hypothetical protein D3C73_1290800 [compost metagenome]
MSVFRLLSVVHTILIREQQILLLKRCNTGHDDGLYGLPLGRLEGGEQLHEAEPVNIIPFVKQALDDYRDGIWFASYGWK